MHYPWAFVLLMLFFIGFPLLVKWADLTSKKEDSQEQN